MTLVAGVDSSTQSCKVVVRDLETGEVVRTGRAPHPEGTAVDPEAWWHALLGALDDAGGLDDVSAISIGGQQHGMVALDADGRVIRDALLWNDTRSAGAARDLIAEVGAEALAERTGLVPVASFTITKVRWLRDSEPQNAERVAAVALPHDWLTWRLRGYGPAGDSELGADLSALTTDRSDASGTGYWSPSTGAYDTELFRIALGHDATLPTVLAPGAVVDTRALGYTTKDITIAVGAGDNAAAGLGLGAREGDVVISIGTSGTVFAVTESAVRDTSGAVAGFADASGAFLPLIATLNAARVLDAFTRVLDVSHDELGDLALDASPGAAGAVLVPYFEGERTPNLPDATAQLTGLSLASTTRPNLARAAIEGMLCGLADGLDAIRAQGVQADRALLIGGAAQNEAVATIAAQVLGIPVSVPTPGEYVAMGASVQAGWALTGSRPAWTVAASEVVGVDPQPLIREQYRAAQSKV